MNQEHKQSPIDAEVAAQLEAKGLRLGLVDTADPAAFSAWLRAETRGFHAPAVSEESLEADVKGFAYRRTSGVWDDSSVNAHTPVGTVNSFPTEFSVPGRRGVTAWAISAVTVAPTHRRRGIARALISSELSTAHQHGVPLAILTVSEATIYGRFGFAPAAMAADWRIDTRRTRWIGPTPAGRVHLITLEQLRELGPALVDRVRLDVPGEIELWDSLWDRMLGFTGDDKDLAKQLRAVRYDDESGAPQGFALYRLIGTEGDFSAHDIDARYVMTATDDAYAALWRYLVEMDLVSTVTAPLRSVDEPFAWQLSDFRAVRRTKQSDHLWTRILDVPAALGGRGYSAPGSFELEVSDPLGYAAGRFLLTVDETGAGSVERLADTQPAAASHRGGAATLSLSVSELSALYLGGVSAVTLSRAGRIVENTPGAAAALDVSFRSEVTPWLSIWF